MAKITWDGVGERYYETGTKNGVLYPQDKTGKYQTGVAWNGLTAVTESPSGADNTDMYADDTKYASLRATETFGATIEAYTYPDEFAMCDGSAEIAPGITIGQQNRSAFGFTYRTKISNDVQIDEYKLHLIYGATASPSEKSYSTINESPDAITFSWEVTTTPVNVEGYKPTASLTIDSRKIDKDTLKAIEEKLYGTENTEPTLPLPEEIIAMIDNSDSGSVDESETLQLG